MCKGLCLLVIGVLLLLLSFYFFISLIQAVGVLVVALVGLIVALEGVDLMRSYFFFRRLDKRVRT